MEREFSAGGVLVKQIGGGADVYADVRNVSFWFPRGGVTMGVNLDPARGDFGHAFIREQDFSAGEVQTKLNIALQRLDDSERIEWKLTIPEISST